MIKGKHCNNSATELVEHKSDTRNIVLSSNTVNMSEGGGEGSQGGNEDVEFDPADFVDALFAADVTA